MKTAIGTKMIRFESMSEEEFTVRKECMEHGFDSNREIPVNVPVNNQTPGYHVQYDNPDGSGYDSWSPKDVFEASYQDIANNLTFEHMLFLMKTFPLKKYAREGFKDYSPSVEYIYLDKDMIMFVKFWDKSFEKALKLFDGIPIDDILANDWYEVK